MAPYSHSIPAVIGGALLGSLLYEAIARRPGALLIAVAWCSHWFADLVTGTKPIVTLDHMIGLDAYHLPWLDFVIESLLVTFACMEFARAMASDKRARRIVVGMWLALLGAQVALDVSGARLDPSPWKPSLAQGFWRPHVRSVALRLFQPITLHGSCTARLHSEWSETCRPRVPRVWLRWSA